MKLSIYERIFFLIFAAVGFYICERHGYKSGFSDAMGMRIVGLLKADADEQEDHTKQHDYHFGECSNCLFKIMDMETGEMECGNVASPAFGNQVLNADTCNSYCYDIRIEERRKSNDD